MDAKKDSLLFDVRRKKERGEKGGGKGDVENTRTEVPIFLIKQYRFEAREERENLLIFPPHLFYFSRIPKFSLSLFSPFSYLSQIRR